jgi:hypothetical protein
MSALGQEQLVDRCGARRQAIGPSNQSRLADARKQSGGRGADRIALGAGEALVKWDQSGGARDAGDQTSAGLRNEKFGQIVALLGPGL